MDGPLGSALARQVAGNDPTRPPARDPEEAEAVSDAVHAEISAAARVGAVHLTVADLDRSLAYYRGVFGLEVIGQEADGLGDGARHTSLGVGDRVLLVLVESPGAPHPARGSTGLYHFALLVPERADLARWLTHAGREEVPLVGMADHCVSEAVYLADPDGHGIEVYRDRPRQEWEGQVGRMTTEPLDVAGLLGVLPDPAAATFAGLPAGTTMGHVHLKVSEIPPAIAFYRDVLGFGLMASLGSTAAFLSAGGYHHHIGANTWESAAGRPPVAGTASLRHLTVLLPDAEERERVSERLRRAGQVVEQRADGVWARDPSGNALHFSVPSRAAG
jgi:catechol 2,3-dioxygenase